MLLAADVGALAAAAACNQLQVLAAQSSRLMDRLCGVNSFRLALIAHLDES